MKKDDIQDILDETVRKYAEVGNIYCYCDVPISELTREELMALLAEAYEEKLIKVERHFNSISPRKTIM